MMSRNKKNKLLSADAVKRAVIDSFIKLNPVVMMKNPVMFVVEVGHGYRAADGCFSRIF